MALDLTQRTVAASPKTKRTTVNVANETQNKLQDLQKLTGYSRATLIDEALRIGVDAMEAKAKAPDLFQEVQAGDSTVLG